MDSEQNKISLSNLKITLIYLVVAALWIVFTDHFVEYIASDSQYLSTLQTYKGWLYVFLTSVGLFYLIKKHDQQMYSKEKELAQALADLKAKQELNSALFDRIPVMIVTYDPHLRELRANKEFEKVSGWTADEIDGFDLLRKLYPDEENRKKAAEFMKSADEVWNEFAISTKSGEKIPTSWTNLRLTNDTSVGIGIDLSEIKASQAKFHESQQLLNKMFEALNESVIILDMDSRTIIGCNQRTTQMFGYSKEELIGSSTRKLHVSAAKYMVFDERSKSKLLKNGIFQTEVEMQRKDGSTFYSDHTITLVKDPENNIDKIVSVVRDITEQKKYQRQLEERNEFIETTLDNLPIGVATNTMDEGKATLMNKKFSEIYGWPQEVLKDVDTFFEKVYPEKDYRKEITEQIQKDIASRDPERMQWKGVTITTQEGEEKIINAKNIPLYDQNLMISTVVDVTQQKKLERELQKEKQRFKLVAQTTSDVIWDLDFPHKKLWWSKGFKNLVGYDRKSLSANYNFWEEIIHPQDRERVSQSSEKALFSDSKKWTEEYQIVKSNGNIAHIIDRAIIIRDDDGNPIRMVGAMEDITKRRETEKKLRESEEKYRHLFKNNPEPMWIYNPDTLKFVEVNQAAINHYGYSEDEFLNMTLLDVRPPEDAEKLKENVQESLGATSYSEEWVHLKKDGTQIDVSVSAAEAQYGKDNIYRLVLINDITEQKRMQEKIIQSVLEGEDRERKRIARELHDGLGQYLVAAHMNFQSVKPHADKLSEKRRKQFSTGVSLLKNALSETRSIAHNLMPKAIGDYGLITALENMIQDFEKSTDITFQFDHNCGEISLKKQVEINLFRICQEIISNAVRHAECSNISILLQLKEDTLTLIIEDDGIGAELDEADEEKGLGFRSIKTRVQNLKGTLDISSEPGEGMKVTVTFPEANTLLTNQHTNGQR